MSRSTLTPPARSTGSPGFSERGSIPRNAVTTSPMKTGHVIPQSPVISGLRFEDKSVTHARQELRNKLNKLVRVTQDMTKRVGAGHHLVVKAKKELKRLRNLEEELRWTAVVCYHKKNIEEAERATKQGKSLDILDRAVQEACDSELGPGHSLCVAGKRALTVIAKARQNERVKEQQEKHRVNLKRAVDSGKAEELEKAINLATKEIGRGHPHVQKALEILKDFKFEVKHRKWQLLVSSFKDGMARAVAENDEMMLKELIRKASSTKLGAGHAVVKQGKRWLEALKKRKRLEDLHQKEKQASDMLTSVLLEATGALNKLEMEVAHETHLDNVYIGRGGGIHLNQ